MLEKVWYLVTKVRREILEKKGWRVGETPPSYFAKGFCQKKKKKMFPGYSKVRRREHFEDIGGKAITGRSKSIGLAKAGQTEQLGEGGNQ